MTTQPNIVFFKSIELIPRVFDTKAAMISLQKLLNHTIDEFNFINWNGELYIENRYHNESLPYFRPYNYGVKQELINKLKTYQNNKVGGIKFELDKMCENKTLLFQIYYIDDFYDLKHFDCLNNLVKLNNYELLTVNIHGYTISKLNIVDNDVNDVNDVDSKVNNDNNVKKDVNSKVNNDNTHYKILNNKWKVFDIYSNLKTINNNTLNEVEEKIINYINEPVKQIIEKLVNEADKKVVNEIVNESTVIEKPINEINVDDVVNEVVDKKVVNKKCSVGETTIEQIDDVLSKQSTLDDNEVVEKQSIVDDNEVNNSVDKIVNEQSTVVDKKVVNKITELKDIYKETVDKLKIQVNMLNEIIDSLNEVIKHSTSKFETEILSKENINKIISESLDEYINKSEHNLVDESVKKTIKDIVKNTDFSRYVSEHFKKSITDAINKIIDEQDYYANSKDFVKEVYYSKNNKPLLTTTD